MLKMRLTPFNLAQIIYYVVIVQHKAGLQIYLFINRTVMDFRG